jgi:hypothetical protein
MICWRRSGEEGEGLKGDPGKAEKMGKRAMLESCNLD